MKTVNDKIPTSINKTLVAQNVTTAVNILKENATNTHLSDWHYNSRNTTTSSA
jgi:hypothetical protein